MSFWHGRYWSAPPFLFSWSADGPQGWSGRGPNKGYDGKYAASEGCGGRGNGSGGDDIKWDGLLYGWNLGVNGESGGVGYVLCKRGCVALNIDKLGLDSPLAVCDLRCCRSSSDVANLLPQYAESPAIQLHTNGSWDAAAKAASCACAYAAAAGWPLGKENGVLAWSHCAQPAGQTADLSKWELSEHPVQYGSLQIPKSLPGAFILAYAKYGFKPFFKAWCCAAIRLLVIRSMGRGNPVGGSPPRKADEETGTLDLKLDVSLVSADGNALGYGNLDDGLLESEFDLAWAGECRGLFLSSDFSEGVLRCADGDVLWEDELWLLLHLAWTGVVEALPFDDGVLEWAFTEDALSSGVLVFSLVRHDS